MKTKEKKKILTAALLALAAVVVGGVVIATSMGVSVLELIAPTAPQSKPEAAGWKHSSQCDTSFSVSVPE